MAGGRRSGVHRIRTVRRIALLASAVRQDILDSVDAIGPCSVAELARVLGRSPHGLYHHLKRLERARLIKLRRTRGADGRSRVALEGARDGPGPARGGSRWSVSRGRRSRMAPGEDTRGDLFGGGFSPRPREWSSSWMRNASRTIDRSPCSVQRCFQVVCTVSHHPLANERWARP